VSAVDQQAPAIELATLDLDSFAGRRVAVLGLARSGIALCRFLADRGARVTVYDRRPAEELAAALGMLEDRAVRALLGPEVDPAQALAGQALVCTSPSVSSRFNTTEPRLRAALARLEAEGSTPIVSEIDLFLRLCPARTVGVTGTKGKTTTSALTAAVLEAGSAPVVLGGNIGTPLVERLPEIGADQLVVLELSELQLPTISRGTDVAVYTHVSSDHLDRHGSVESYRLVKRRLAELVPADGRLVLNAEDSVSTAFAAASPAPALYYRRGEPLPGGVGVADGWIVANRVEPLTRWTGDSPRAADVRVMPVADVRLPGQHNLSNVLAAVSVGLLHGVAADGIARAVGTFRGVEHRLELVAEIDGVRFVNDSQGTQPDAVIAALNSFEPPIVLIAGGRGKDVELDKLAAEVERRAAAVVLIGETAVDMERLFAAAGAGHLERAADLPAAVRRADAIARELLAADPARRPATVLLSPAAASFDMFTDYAERGQVFKAAVNALVEARR
jgi:UDP-N-acetylmuramoylalanine--D-glutamate ligase